MKERAYLISMYVGRAQNMFQLHYSQYKIDTPSVYEVFHLYRISHSEKKWLSQLILFVCIVALRPSQKLWPLLDGQFT